MHSEKKNGQKRKKRWLHFWVSDRRVLSSKYKDRMAKENKHKAVNSIIQPSFCPLSSTYDHLLYVFCCLYILFLYDCCCNNSKSCKSTSFLRNSNFLLNNVIAFHFIAFISDYRRHQLLCCDDFTLFIFSSSLLKLPQYKSS